MYRRFEKGHQNAHRSTQPKIGAIKQGEITLKANAATTGFDILGPQFAQFLRERFFEAAGTGGKKFQRGAFNPRRLGALPNYIAKAKKEDFAGNTVSRGDCRCYPT